MVVGSDPQTAAAMNNQRVAALAGTAADILDQAGHIDPDTAAAAWEASEARLERQLGTDLADMPAVVAVAGIVEAAAVA